MSNIYADVEKRVAECFNLDKETTMEVYDSDIYKFDFTDIHTLNLSCLTDSGFTLIKSYRGKFDTKNNYFTITFIKKRHFFLLYNKVENDRIKIGLDSLGNLFLNKEYDMSGFAVVYGAGYEYDNAYSLKPVDKIPFHPQQSGTKWGYADEHGKFILDAKYDFARFFEDSLAQVSINGRWGIIRKDGCPVTPFKYKSMRSFGSKDYSYIRDENGMMGLIDRSGKEILSPVYDDIGTIYPSTNTGISRLKDKYGVVSTTEEILPPVFDEIRELGPYSRYGNGIPDQLCTVVLGKSHYYIDKWGYMYKLRYNRFFKAYWVVKDSKRHYKEVIKDAGCSCCPEEDKASYSVIPESIN